MSPIGRPPSHPACQQGADGVPAAHVRDVLRTFRKALVLEGLMGEADRVTVSNEAHEKADGYRATTDMRATNDIIGGGTA